MGEYAHDAMRQEVMGRHCDAKPKAAGLWQHVRDVHGISQAEQALAKVPEQGGCTK